MTNRRIYFIPSLLLLLLLTACGASALERATEAVGEGNYEQALIEYDTALTEELSPEDRVSALTGRARVYNEQNNSSAALADYATALTVTTAEGTPAGDLIAIYRSRIDIMKKDGDSVAAADEIGKLLPLDSANLALYLDQGQLYADAEQWESVVSSMDEALKVNSSSSDAYTLRGTAHLELRNFEQAIEDLKSSLDGEIAAALSDIDRRSNLVDAYYELGQALYNIGDYQRSIDNFTEALTFAESDKDVARTLAERGFVYSEIDEFAKAIADFEVAIELDPNMAIVYSYRSYVYVEQENYEAAIADADKAITLGSDLSASTRSAIFHAKASALLNNGQYDEALIAANESINLEGVDSPDAARTYSLRSRIHRSLGDYEAAVVDADKALEIGANDVGALPGFYYSRSIANYWLDNYDEALADQLASMELGEPNAGDYEYLGDIYYYMDDEGKATEAYKTAISLEPTNAWLHYYLGDIYEGSGDDASALASYEQAVALDPTEVSFIEALADLKWSAGDHDGAIAGYQQALQIDPTDPWLHNYLGDIYYDIDEDAAAENEYRTATQLDSEVALFFENLGLSLRVQEKLEEALVAYTSALELDPDSGFSWFGRGYSYYLLGSQNDANAIADMQKAKEYDLGQDLIDFIDELLVEMGA
ncbi:MAG: tetratricopeptide (TPR) repeat protein [Cellvibrionaceae bacterium]|jgi:tetratricopeptide (TPR) repeat protein